MPASAKKAQFELSSTPGSYSDSGEDIDDELVRSDPKTNGKDVWERASMAREDAAPKQVARSPDESTDGTDGSRDDVPDVQPPERQKDEGGVKAALNGTNGTSDDVAKAPVEKASQAQKRPLADSRQSLSNLFHNSTHPTTAPPKVTAETATAYHEQRRAAVASAGTSPAGVRPDSQPVTSRFILSDSPGRGGSSSPSSSSTTPSKRASQSYHSSLPTPGATPPSATTPIASLDHLPKSTTRTLPNRTQSKLLLQRQSSQYEIAHEHGVAAVPPPVSLHTLTEVRNGSVSSGNLANQQFDPTAARVPREIVKEVERINREYANVRRFVSPVGSAVARLREYAKQNRIPGQPRRSFEREGAGPGSLGLSQSLGANAANGGPTGKLGVVGAGGSKDDSGIASRRRSMGKMDEARIRELCLQIWTRDDPPAVNSSMGSN